MKHSNIFRTLLFAAALLLPFGAMADSTTLASWGFENTEDATTWFSSEAPSLAPDSCVGESSDYVMTALSTNRYWQLTTGWQVRVLRIENTDANAITDYTDASQHNVYYEVSFPTTGYKNIAVNFAVAYGGNAEATMEVVVSTDGGTTWADAGSITTTAAWWTYQDQSVSLSANNKEKVIVRLIAGNDFASNWNLDYLNITGEASEAGTAVSADGLTVTWPFNLGTNNDSNGEVSQEGVMSVASVALGENINYLTTRTAGGLTFSTIQPTEVASEDADANAMSFTITPKKGLTMTPTSLTFSACRIGTNGGAFDVVAYCDGQTYELLMSETPQLVKTDPYFSSYTIDLSSIPATTSTLNIKIYIRNLATNKEYGFTNFVVTMNVNGTIEAVPAYTLAISSSDSNAGTVSSSPAGTEFDEGTSLTVSATENFGYHFQSWVDADGNVVSEENPYSFEIAANTTLKAVYTAKNVYAMNLSYTNGARTNLVTVEPEGNLVDGVHYYEEGTQVKLTALNNKILTFTNWEDNTTAAERTITIDEEKNITANYSACDYIVGWDLYDTSVRQDRAAEYASDSENAGLLVLRNAAGTSLSWLGSVMNGKSSARVWRNLTENDYFEISFSTTGYNNVKVSAAVGDDYNAHSVIYMQASLDGTNYTTVGTYNLPNRGWDEQEFALPDSFSNQTKVWVRFMPDYDSDLTGVTSDYDGTGVAEIFVLADADATADETAPQLVSSLPANDATDVTGSGSVVLTFDEKVQQGTGDVTLAGETLTGTFSGKTVVYKYSALDYSTQYTFTVPAGAITDRNGNAFEGCTITFTTMDRNQPEPRLYDLVIAQDGSGDYTTFQEAIDAAPANQATPYLIFVKAGTYEEHVDIPASKPYLFFIGQDKDLVKISDNRLSGGDNAYHVSKGATVVDNAANTLFENISFVNSWGVEQNAGPQALALYTVNDRVVLNKCGLYSYQDTYLTTTNANYRHYVKDCFIEGAVDFIYGQGNVFFDECTINIVRKSGGYIVAPNHVANTTWGYVFMNNTITAPGVPSETSVWLGRPWHNNPKTVFINTTAEVTIPAAGWYDHMGGLPSIWADYNTMNADGSLQDLSNRRDTYYYINGTDTVWGTAKNYLTDEEAAEYTVKNVLSGDDAWQPTVLIEECEAPAPVISDTKITWDAVPYAMCYVITCDSVVVAFTTDTEYDGYQEGSTYTVQAANEYGCLSPAGTAVSTTDAITSANDNAATVEAVYNLSGQKVGKDYKGVGIVKSRKADGSCYSRKVIK